MTDGEGEWEAFFASVCDEARARAEAYSYPLVFGFGSDAVIEIEVPDLDRDEELHMAEMVLRENNMTLPGFVLFCQHPDDGFMLVSAEPDGWHFHQMPEGESEFTEIARPEFWALQVSGGVGPH